MIRYKKRQKYKYNLHSDFQYETGIIVENPKNIGLLEITATGKLIIRKGYSWDGPSGPTIDTKSFMRGSLVHDALYQLMREKYLDCKIHRKYADDLLKKICLDDGMCRLRAWYVYQAVRLCAEKHATPTEKPKDEIICVP